MNKKVARRNSFVLDYRTNLQGLSGTGRKGQEIERELMADKDPVNELRIQINSSEVGNQSWLDAIKELENQAPEPVARKKPAPTPAPEKPKPTPVKALQKERQRSRASNSQTKEDLMDLMETAESQVTQAKSLLEAFIKKHPYLIAPNIHRMWEDSLQETAVTLQREQRKRQKD